MSVNPISSNYYVPGITGTPVSSVDAYAAYEQLVAIQESAYLDSIGTSSSGSGTVDVGLASADLLNLSPAALNILNGIESVSSGNGLSGATDTLGLTGTFGVGSGSGSSTTLTTQQQAQVTAIVAQYATAPVTQQTFTQIENALTAAGINPQAVSLQQLLTGYQYSYEPGFAFSGDLFTDTLASELTDA